VRVGCSGWSYPDWRGLVYPAELPQSRWLPAYARWFDTVELNNTFYRLPTEAAVDRWADNAPAGFTFAVKVGQFGSHRKKLTDPEPWLARHLERARRLGPHLGPNLVQLPPRWSRNTERLETFLAACPPDIRWAVELRDPSWLHDDVFETLARHRAALCLHDLLADHPWELTADWTYVRFHGPDATNRPYHGRYAAARLAAVADRLGDWRRSGIDVYAYFNNDHAGNAVVDATRLRTLIDPETTERFDPIHVGSAA
jgi:uncharacterized protein YecE (DUF72 family)